MAVEMWLKRDHEAETRQWHAWLNTIAAQVSKIAGVTTSVVDTTDLSNRTPTLNIQWDRRQIGVTGAAVASQLMATEPRIATPGGRDQGDQGGISVTPYMMAPGDEKIIADRISAALAGAPRPEAAKAPAPPAADLTGQWDVQIDYLASTSQHALYLKQTGNRLEGSHQGNFVSRDVSGTIDGTAVQIASAYSAHGDSLNFRFMGAIAGAELSGTSIWANTCRRSKGDPARLSAHVGHHHEAHEGNRPSRRQRHRAQLQE